MSKRTKKAALTKKSPGSITSLRSGLSGRTKAELIDALLELAEADRKVLRHLSAQFDFAVHPAELVVETHQAIIDATSFDPREMNRNFDYDYAAYDEVKRNLQRLIKMGQMRQAMGLSLELMKRGSYQVEMSDEGLMTSDIEDCLGVVLTFLTKCDLPTQELITWCSAMLKADRGEYIATEELRSLRSHVQSRAAQQHRQK